MLCVFSIFALLLFLFIPIAISEARIIASVDVREVMNYLKTPLNDLQQFLNQFIPEKDSLIFQQNIQDKLVSPEEWPPIGDGVALRSISHPIALGGAMSSWINPLSIETTYHHVEEKLVKSGFREASQKWGAA